MDPPQVTVTGHSLGGTLAQITAHHFDLRGETFNAYGAASLGYRIPEGGDRVTNHAMATDPVSAGSRHYGKLVVYARPDEIQALLAANYANDRNPLDPRNPLGGTLTSMGAHAMHNFLEVDANGRPDRSVLDDPGARQLAGRFAPMIDKFRGDVLAMRATITLAARGGPGNLRDGFNVMLGPLPAGHGQAAPADAALPAAAAAATPTSGFLEREIARRAADAPAPPLVPLQYLPIDPARSSDVLRPPPVQVPLRIEAPAEAAHPQLDVSTWLDRILEAGRLGEADRFRELTQAAAMCEPGRRLRSEAMAHVDRQQALEAARALQAGPVGQQYLHAHIPHQPRDPAAPPVMRLG